MAFQFDWEHEEHLTFDPFHCILPNQQLSHEACFCSKCRLCSATMSDRNYSESSEPPRAESLSWLDAIMVVVGGGGQWTLSPPQHSDILFLAYYKVPVAAILPASAPALRERSHLMIQASRWYQKPASTGSGRSRVGTAPVCFLGTLSLRHLSLRTCSHLKRVVSERPQ